MGNAIVVFAGCTDQRSGQIIFRKSGRGLGHVTPTIFGIWSNISSKLLELVTSTLVCGFVLGLLSGRTFP